jgi:hypothetical protein
MAIQNKQPSDAFRPLPILFYISAANIRSFTLIHVVIVKTIADGDRMIDWLLKTVLV